MRTIRFALLPLVSFAWLGCGMVTPGTTVTPSAGGATAFEVPQAVKDTVRAGEARGDQITDPIEDQEVAKQETEVKHVLAMSLGREGVAAGMAPGEPASQALAELRAAKIQLRIEPVTNAQGGNVADNFVQLKDTFTDRVQALQTKLVSGTATTAERAEVMNGAKQALKLNSLKMQVGAVSRAALMTNVHVQTGGITMMLKIAGMVAVRKQQTMDFTAEDYARVKRIVTRQKHWEAMGAATMGMLAAYEAVVSSSGDPKALDAIADATLRAFPLDPQVSDDDARSYVANLAEDATSQKTRYEAMMRSAYGDAIYEQRYKTGIDAMFAQAIGASKTKTVAEVAGQAQNKYQADLAKCARGEALDPGSLVGPAKCKDARAQVLSGGGASDGADMTVAGSGLGGAGGGSGLKGAQKGVANVQQGIAVASAVAKGDAAGALQGAAGMFPGDGPIQSSLQGIAALSRKDFKGALKSAIGLASLIPGGAAIKEGLGVAGKLLNLFG